MNRICWEPSLSGTKSVRNRVNRVCQEQCEPLLSGTESVKNRVNQVRWEPCPLTVMINKASWWFQGSVCSCLDSQRSSSTTLMTLCCLSSTRWASPTWWPEQHQAAKISAGESQKTGNEPSMTGIFTFCVSISPVRSYVKEARSWWRN